MLDNLVENALEASPPGGTVTVTAAGSELRVRDEGPGLSAEQRERAFDRFWRARAGEGSGLGLAIVRRLVEADGGDVELEPAPGGGLEAVVRLRRRAVSGAPGFACISEREALDMELAARDGGLAQVGHDPVDESGRAADIDVAVGEVRDQLLEMARREQVGRLGAPCGRRRGTRPGPPRSDAIRSSSPAKTMSRARRDPVEDDEVAFQPLEQRPHGRDPDPARDHQRLRPDPARRR